MVFRHILGVKNGDPPVRILFYAWFTDKTTYITLSSSLQFTIYDGHEIGIFPTD